MLACVTSQLDERKEAPIQTHSNSIRNGRCRIGRSSTRNSERSVLSTNSKFRRSRPRIHIGRSDQSGAGLLSCTCNHLHFCLGIRSLRQLSGECPNQSSHHQPQRLQPLTVNRRHKTTASLNTVGHIVRVYLRYSEIQRDARSGPGVDPGNPTRILNLMPAPRVSQLIANERRERARSGWRPSVVDIPALPFATAMERPTPSSGC